MSVLGKIISTIFGHANAAPAAAPAVPTGSAAPPSSSAKSAAGGAVAATSPAAKSSGSADSSTGPVDVAAILTKLAASNKERLDWQKSIVDLMKLLKLDSSLSARKELAKELHYTGDTKNSATMNMWLHKQVMIELAKNGGKVPNSLKT
jgi:hypothetical protein